MTSWIRCCLYGLLLAIFISRGATRSWGAGIGLDAARPTTLVTWFSELGVLDEGRGRWLRLRMGANDSAWQDAGLRYREHNAMQRLRQGGWKLCWFVRWDAQTWAHGTRKGQRLPVDLREVFERCQHLALAYGDAVDAWEIENEPDILFVPEMPETYTAFLKAAYLGFGGGGRKVKPEAGNLRPEAGALRAMKEQTGDLTERGSAEMASLQRWPKGPTIGDLKLETGNLKLEMNSLQAMKEQTGDRRPEEGNLKREIAARKDESLTASATDNDPTPWVWRWLLKDEGTPTSLAVPRGTQNVDGSRPLAVMAPWALPPGPYFEAFQRNDGLSYTDGFNFHYYGYPQDFTGVYRQFEAAVGEGAGDLRAERGNLTERGSAEMASLQRWPNGPTIGDLKLETGNLKLEMGDLTKRGSVKLRSEGGNLKDDVGAQQDESLTASATEEERLRLGARERLGGGNGRGVSTVWRRLFGWAARGEKTEASRALPVFVTEFGYAWLSAADSNTVAGRDAQARWFQQVTPQMAQLKIEAPMAFYLPPYFSGGKLEFGLLRNPTPSLDYADGNLRPEAGDLKGEGGGERRDESLTASATDGGRPRIAPAEQAVERAREGGGERMGESLTASATMRRGDAIEAPRSKLGERRRDESLTASATGGGRAGGKAAAESSKSTIKIKSTRGREAWRGRAGEKVDGKEVTPALAWILDGQPGYRKTRSWRVPQTAVSPVVLDFIDGPGLAPWKTFFAHLVLRRERDDAHVHGNARLVLYNFSDSSVSGSLRMPAWIRSGAGLGPFVMLPRGRIEIPLSIAVPKNYWAFHEARIAWVADDGRTPSAHLSTQFISNAEDLPREQLVDFTAAKASAQTQAALLQQRRSAGDPGLRLEHGWAVTPGVSVAPIDGGLRLTVLERAPGTLQRSAVELPWPAGWDFPEDALLALQYRLGPGTVETRGELSIHVRTANGNLYEVWPRQVVTSDWRDYLQAKRNFGMSFYNPAQLPWRLRDNQPVALVIVAYPEKTPAVYDLRHLELIRFGEAPAAKAAEPQMPTD